MVWVLAVVLGGAWALAPFIALYRLAQVQRELRELRARLDGFQRVAAPPPAAPVAYEPLSARVAPSTPPFAAVPSPAGSAPATPAPVARAPVAPAPRPAVEAQGLEDLIGSIWLQNAGAVVLLLGLFFFILWGYNTGRFGPGALVAAGAGIGLASAWRGDRLARSLPRLGHAFIGVGVGAVYLSLYLGHFTLHVLALPLAFALLALTSVVAIAAGLHYRVQAIAAIGVVGAFLPQCLASWLSLKGFALEPGALFGYLAVVDVLVFALASRAGWSALDLVALVLTAVTWRTTYPGGDWSWQLSAGLATLFIGLGLAPLPRLVRVDGSVRPLDLAVVAAAPAGLILSGWSWLVVTPRQSVALLLFAIGVVQLLAAFWVDSRRPERDLWRPLTGTAIVLFTAGLQRILGEENLAIVWCVEGVLLVVLGLTPRGAWLRLCGHVVTMVAMLVALAHANLRQLPAGEPPFTHPDSVRELAILVTLILGAVLLARRREHLAPLERWAPEAWTLAANFLLLGWSWRRCDDLARALEHPAGRWWHGAASLAPAQGERLAELSAALVGFAWFAHAAFLGWRGARSGRGFLRGCAYAIASFAFVAVLWSLLLPDGWSSDRWPVFHPAGWCAIGSLLLGLAIVQALAARRHELLDMERRAPEIATVLLLLLSLVWSAREVDHLARTELGLAGAHVRPGVPATRAALERLHTLGAALTSVAWLIEAVVLLVLGWLRPSPFLRWCGLALLGVTLLKFVGYDLAQADVFWRFLTAIVAGSAMLAVSFAYQRRAKRRRGTG